MTELTSEERVLRALQRQEPDRVPHFEWLVDRKVRAALCPDCTTFNDFAVRMGHDAVLADPDFRKERPGRAGGSANGDMSPRTRRRSTASKSNPRSKLWRILNDMHLPIRAPRVVTRPSNGPCKIIREKP